MNCSRRYLIVSTCRDEAKVPPVYARQRRCTVGVASALGGRGRRIDGRDARPSWRSTSCRLPYLRIVRRTDRGRRRVGPGVIDAFYSGLETVCLDDFDYLCKLDMDLDLPARYFELADAADGKQSAHRDHLWQAVVCPPTERSVGAGGLR